ncbi:aspartate/glutamate racemase family protein [Geomicrobium sp. JCM 19039]|uniref:aspartate/glutamate racemase family protein n=1 Tax=Geomicrobium sp. JCM 19039 TaxID=1460636 RepID=UPI00045F1E55|nr:amino acid racemase [Geomicrobium sp. JCM 19039]GAK12436.1 aspartate racemase [Geomicrobium sp. JCM 19039]
MLGILAGMGPKSTGPFVDTVVNQCQKIFGAKYDIDYPHMLIYSCPTPFYLDRDIDHNELEVSIVDGAKKLESTGVQVIAMPCNTAHLYINSLRKSLAIPILDMVSETVKEILATAKSVALLATGPTVKSGLYQEHLRNSGFNYIHKDEWQEKVINTIIHIKNGEIDRAKCYWNDLLSDLTGEIDTVIIACTDLNVVLEKQESLYIVDSSVCLAKPLIKRYLNLSTHS